MLRQPVRAAATQTTPSASTAAVETAAYSWALRASGLAAAGALWVRRSSRSALLSLLRAANPMSCRRAYNILWRPGSSDTKVLTNGLDENAISIACDTERDSGMDRGDLANLTAFVAVAHQK